MRFDILTLFPKMFESPMAESIIKRAIENKRLEVKIHQLRDWAKDKYKTVDDRPFGGGVGMLLMIEPIAAALEEIKSERVIVLSARGKRFTQKDAERLSKYKQLTLICGHYEGIDARVEENLADEMISIGDYVLTGGELPAMVVVESISRLIPGVLGKDLSSKNESFVLQNNRREIEYPQYTRPRDFKGMKVPDVLWSGDFQKISEWQEKNRKKKPTK